MSAAVSVIAEPSDFTASWLTDALATAGIDATVQDLAVAPVGTGQMARCYRLDISYSSGAGPTRLIAKLPAADPSVRAGASMTYRTEVGFYQELAPQLSVPVPRCYYAEITEEATEFTLLLEDMAPAAVGDQLAGCTAAQARQAAVAVAALHAGSWCDPTLDKLDWLIPRMSSHAELMAPFIQTATQDFIGKRELDADTAQVMTHFAEGFVRWAVDRPSPYSLLHNDYRLDNLLFSLSGNARVTTVDWQSLSVGPPLRDVAFLLGTGLQPAERLAGERGIVAAYHEALLAQGVRDYDDGSCWEDYRHALFQGPFICIMGEAVAAPTERGLRMFTVMAQRAALAIRELDCLELLD